MPKLNTLKTFIRFVCILILLASLIMLNVSIHNIMQKIDDRNYIYVYANEETHIDSSPMVETTIKELELVKPVEVTVDKNETIKPLEIEIEEVWPYSLTQEEIDLIALLTMAEAEGECELGKRLVIDTVLNRVDHECFPDTVYDVVYQKNQYSGMWGSRITKCYVMDSIVDLVKEELINRTDSNVIFFNAHHYSDYGEPYQIVGNHWFSSYD